MKKTLKRTVAAIFGVFVVFIILILSLFLNEIRSLASIKKINDHPLFQMKYFGDYGFDKFLKTGARNDREVESFVTKRLLRGLPIDLGIVDGGCTVFVVKNERGEVLFCRNYDFTYTPAMQLFTAPKRGLQSVSTVELDFAGYTKDFIPSGVNLDSVFALGAPYMPWDGMNEKGLAVALLAVPESYGPNDHDKITLGTTTIIRLILDKAATVDEAVSLMRQYNIYFSAGICSHFLIADASGASVLAEYWDGELQTVTTTEGFQVASNFIAYNGLNIGEGFNEMERYEIANSRIKENGGYLSEQQAIDLLTDVGIYYDGVDKLQWTVIYNLTTLTGLIFSHRDVDNIHVFSLNLSL